ncbi:MAG: D-glycero-beta-D-manno-heptose 1,7-bisphosphate 7-phosphatase [Alphaproteobacteria bacterium]
MKKRYVLLDRDGTINFDAHYLSSPDQLKLLPGAGAGLRRMSALGLGLVVVTNQSGIARGYFTLDQLDAIHERLHRMLAAEGVRLDGLYVCPHGPREDCSCRKPRPGLVERAVAELGFDPAQGFMIGDKVADVKLGQAVGAETVLVRTGYGAEVERKGESNPDHVVDTLAEAAEIIAARLAVVVSSPRGT